MPGIKTVCLTKLNKNSIIIFLTLNGYNFHFVSSMAYPDRVGMYVKNSIIYSIRQGLHIKYSNYESLWLELFIGINYKNSINILVELIYHHPGTSIFEFSKQFSEFFVRNITGYKETCIFGDININSLNDKVNSVKNYLSQIRDFCLTNLINIRNRVNNLGETLIDHF